MDKFVTDQAEGLRRLLAREGPRVIAVTGGAGAPGRTTTVVNLAAALTDLGHEVLVIDECGGERSVAAQLGAKRGAQYGEAIDAMMRDEKTVDDAIERYAPGFGVLTLPRASALPYTREELAARLLRGVADIVLIDAPLGADGALSALALNAHDLLFVTRTDAQAITVAYACIKRLHFAHAIGQFRVVANHVHNDDEGRLVLDNLVGVASRYLAVSLERAGTIAADPHMTRAVELARSLVDAFPSTAAARDYRRLAAELPHWPLRPALGTLAAAAAHRPGGGGLEGGSGGVHADRLTGVPDVSTVTSIADAATAHAGWQTGPAGRRRATHYA